MARARLAPLATARLVLAPLLALVAVLAGLLLGPAALVPVPRPTVATLAGAATVVPLAGSPRAAHSLALVVLREPVRAFPRGPTFTSAAMPATIASAAVGPADPSGRRRDAGPRHQDQSASSRGLELRSEAIDHDAHGPRGPPSRRSV